MFLKSTLLVTDVCGHDVHMASLLSVAKILSELKEEIEGTAVFFRYQKKV